jgi:4-amino-4-deoxy-L-arabinose transferase-like glycosyltransferase
MRSALAVGALLALFLLQEAVGIRGDSGTVDEAVYLPAGYTYWATGDFRLNAEHPPLAKLLVAAPLFMTKVRSLADSHPAWRDARGWLFGRDFLYRVNDADRVLLVGRFAVVGLALVLGVAVHAWARRLYGGGAGLLALALYVFSPDVLAYGRLATTDFPAAGLLFLSVYSLFRLLERPSVGRIALTGLLLGLALAARQTSLILLLIFPALGLVWAAGSSSVPMERGFPPRGEAEAHVAGRGSTLGRRALGALGVGGIAYGVLWAVYGFQAHPTGRAEYELPWSLLLSDPVGVFVEGVEWARAHRLLPDAYLYGLMVHGSGILPRCDTFLLGRISPDGWWYFFLVTFFLKTPLSLLLLLAASLWGVRFRRQGFGRNEAFLLIPVLLGFTFVSAAGIQNGHRHLLPIYPFLFVLAGRSVLQLPRNVPTALVLWYVGASLWVFPHHLSYMNEMVLGPGNGHRVLVDSSLDWGQDLKRLKRYMDSEGVQRVKLSYFGSAPPEYYGIASEPLPSFPPVGQAPPSAPVSLAPSGVYAISATNLRGVCLEPPVRQAFLDLFGDREPTGSVGYSILIYRFDEPDRYSLSP